MAEELLPLFPLQVVALPKSIVPLHIFEERYKKMVGASIRDKSEFGIVLVHEEGIVNAGCTVFVDQILKEYPDGRMDIQCMGTRRFEVVLLNQEEEFLQGTVQYFDDDPEAPDPDAELKRQAIHAWRDVRGLTEKSEATEPDLAEPELSFVLAQIVSDLNNRQVLLQMRSEAERLAHLVQFFRNFLVRQKRVLEIRRIAPTNGHSQLDQETSREL
jgi:Lon protease-like protein